MSAVFAQINLAFAMLAQVVLGQGGSDDADVIDLDDDAQNLYDSGTGLRSNGWLDEYEFHFGEWIKQIVDWVDINLGWLLDAIIWPFEFLFRLLMNTDDAATSIMSLPWYWVAIAFFLLGAIARNTRIGLMAGALVAACGLLGPDYWSETTKTFGMVFVSVLLCAIIGIPLGVLCGRVDSAWNAVRPLLDAMQVVHPFVYMLPFIFFWSAGEESATMATLVFALPPLVRLTNLGVRQVPDDVVEASRAFGASEYRVLTDVQLPLARPAIMTGLNQTLLMAISMLGIAAIMGAGGLGKLLLQAISSNNLPQATSGGLAYFFVAVVLDRITQRESTDGLGLFGRIRESWALRREPEALLAAQQERAAGAEATAEAEAIVDAVADERAAPVGAAERLGLLIGLAGSVVAALSAFLAWGSDAGLISGWGRRADETDLVGQSFMGIEASGGSMFGVLVLALSAIGALCAVRPLVSIARGPALASTLSRLQGVGVTFLLGLGLAVWLNNIFDGDFGSWIDGSSGGYNRIWTLIILVAGLALGEYVSRRLIGAVGWFVGAFVLAMALGATVGSDGLSDIGLIAFGLIVISMVVETFVNGTPRMGADGLTITALAAFALAVAYFLTGEAPGVVQYAHGIGVWLAIIGAAGASVGGLMALFAAPYASRVPFKLNIKWGLIAGAAFAFVCLLATVIAPWVSDARLDTLMTPELTAEIERLREEAGDDINKQIANGQAITNLINSAQADPVLQDGLEGDGPGLGWPMLVFAGAALVATVFAAGVLASDETPRWRFATIATGLGLGAFLIPTAWIASFARTAEPRVVSGNGTFFAMCLTFVFVAIGRGVISTFRRRVVYRDAERMERDDDSSIDLRVESDQAGQLVSGAGD